jgi:hypothetical protein
MTSLRYFYSGILLGFLLGGTGGHLGILLLVLQVALICESKVENMI